MAGFRFAVSATRPRPREEWIAFARSVEAAGFDRLLMPDHFGARLATGPALVLAAAVTERLRVGSFVYNNDFRHPALLAQEAATIDVLTGGRFDLGIGAGWLRAEYDAAGLPFAAGSVRVARLAEAIRIIKDLMTETPITRVGVHYRLTNLTGSCKPLQQPHPPFLIGGGGPKLLALAAQEADIISIMPRSKADGAGLEDTDASADAFEGKVALIRKVAGNRFPRLWLNTLVQAVRVSDDREKVAAEMAPEWGMAPAQLLDSPLLLIGTVDQMVEQVRARRERFGLSYLTVFERDMASFAGVVERLVGPGASA
ncbi:MAG: TIGR03621 family F420-dependent LLM class oxidoreductase [Candidatus Dormibacteraeota bacterium]|nr:TIGR03621 family F420-dependent LLM class oxidoreductase [Candidatus Dormibacteraeota bacterium]